MKDSCLSCWYASNTIPFVLLPQGTDDQPARPGLINSTSNGTGEEMVTVVIFHWRSMYPEL